MPTAKACMTPKALPLALGISLACSSIALAQRPGLAEAAERVFNAQGPAPTGEQLQRTIQFCDKTWEDDQRALRSREVSTRYTTASISSRVYQTGVCKWHPQASERLAIYAEVMRKANIAAGMAPQPTAQNQPAPPPQAAPVGAIRPPTSPRTAPDAGVVSPSSAGSSPRTACNEFVSTLPKAGVTRAEGPSIIARLREGAAGPCSGDPRAQKMLEMAGRLETKLAAPPAPAAQAASVAPPTAPAASNYPDPKQDPAYLAFRRSVACGNAATPVIQKMAQPGLTPQLAQEIAAELRSAAAGICAGLPQAASLNETADHLLKLAGQSAARPASAPVARSPGPVVPQATYAAQPPAQYAAPPTPAPKPTVAPRPELHGPSLAELEQRNAGARANAEAMRQLEASQAKIRQEEQKRAAEAAARQARKDAEQRQREDYARQQNEPSRVLGDLLQLRRQQDNAEKARVAPEVSNPNAVRTEVSEAIGGKSAVIRAYNQISVPLRITVRYRVSWPDGVVETGEKTCTSPARQFCELLVTHVNLAQGRWSLNVLNANWADARY